MTTTKITFWGTRGSYPIASLSTIKVGGRTSCVSVEGDGLLILLDAGSGLIALGDEPRLNHYQEATLLLSHLHHDHIMGIPFFKPLFDKKWTLHFYSGVAAPYGGLEKVLATCFSPPYFPLDWGKFPAARTYQDFHIGQELLCQGKRVETLGLDHPGGACGYRIYLSNSQIVYLTDTKHTDASWSDFIKFSQGADLLIYDSTFTDDEFALHPDWGHSTWRAATKLAQAADVKRLALFHHNPDHTDPQMQKILHQAQAEFAQTILAIDGLEIDL